MDIEIDGADTGPDTEVAASRKVVVAGAAFDPKEFSLDSTSAFFDPENINILVKASKTRVRFLVQQLIDSYSDKVMFQQNDSSAFLISVEEVKCGDAKCAPLHVDITLTFKETKNSTTITI